MLGEASCNYARLGKAKRGLVGAWERLGKA